MTRTRWIAAGSIPVVAALLVVGAAPPALAQYKDEEVLALDAEIDALSATFPALKPFPLEEEDGNGFLQDHRMVSFSI